jgi:hypothetical protein
MRNDLANNVSHECYVVEIDGIKQSEHRIFVEALKRGFELKRQHQHSAVKLRDAEDIPRGRVRFWHIKTLKLFNSYRVRRLGPKVAPAG